MSFANINIGASAGDHGGDPIRTAFQKINNNFQQITDGTIDINVSSPVQSVAGRTGNVVLTANDIIGTVTQGQVLGLIEQTLAETSVSTFYNDAEYADIGYVDSAVSGAIGDLVGAAPAALDTLYEIATSLGNNASLSSSLTNSIGAVASNVSILQSDVSSAESAITALQSNAASQQSLINTNSTNIVTLSANAATQATEITNLWANAASQKSSLDSVSTDLSTLFANAASQKSSLDSLTSNAAAQQSQIESNSADIVTLFANAATQKSSLDSVSADLSTLFANAAAQKSSLDSLVANAGAQSDAISTNTTDIATLFTNAATQNTSINNLWANAATQQSAIDSAASSITTLTSNAAAQHSSIADVVANVTAIQQTVPYSDSNVAAYLPTYGGNLTANVFSVGQNNTIPSASTIALINNNSDAAIASSGTLQVVAKADTTSHIVFDAVSDSPLTSASYISRRARGTLAAPSRVLSGDSLGSFTTKGYTPAGFTSGRGPGITVFASQDFTETSQAANVVIYITQSNSSGASPHTRFEANGAAVINTGIFSTSPTSGPLQVIGGIGVTGNINISNSLHASGGVNAASIDVGPIRATATIYANGIANDNWMWANGAPIAFQYSDSDVATYLASNTIEVNGLKSDNWFWANSEPITLGYNDINVQTYLSSNDVTISGVKSDNYMWANADPVSFVTYGSDNGILVGNINITERNLTATGGNAWPLSLDFPTVAVEHNLTVGGDVEITSATDSSNHTTGALVIEGGLGVGGNVYVAGNPSSRFQVGEGGAFFENVIAQFTANIDGYAQINMQNLSNDPSASSDLVATADTGSDAGQYVNLGINNSTFSDVDYPGMAPLDSYLIADGGNLLLIAESSGKTITFMQGGYDYSDVIGTWNTSALSVNTDIIASLDVTAQGNVAATYFNGDVVGTNATITNIDSYTGHFASNLATSYMAFGADPLNRNAGLLGQVVDSLGFTTQYGNGVIMVNEQGSVEQNLFLGDTDVTSNATLLGVSVTNGGGYNRVLNLTGTGNLFVSNVYATVYGDVSYTPANVSNWNSSVTTIAEALDELAQRLKDAGF